MFRCDRRRLQARFSLWVLVVTLAGCEPHQHEAPAEPEEKASQITVWGERFEIFLEHKYILVNDPTRFITHATDLKTLQPRREGDGKVVFVLQHGSDAPIEHVEEGPARDGIYIPSLTFPKVGKWSVTLRIAVDGGVSVVNLPPFTVYGSQKDIDDAPEPEEAEGISFLKEQQWKVLTRTDPVGTRRMVERLRLPGVVLARPVSRAAVTPPVAGRLLEASKNPLPSIGDRVKKGQTLALVQPPFSEFAARIVEANAEAIKAKLTLDHAEMAHTRIKNLAAANAKSRRELQEAEFALRTAEASHKAAVSLKTAYENAGAVFVGPEGAGLPALELKSPIDGVVVQVSATLGEYTSTDRAVFTVLDTASVYIEARIPESDVRRIGSSKGATYETLDAKGQYVPILGEGGGRVVHLGLDVDARTRTVPLLYEVPNPKGHLRLGMTLTVYLETARAEDTLAVPASAVVDEDARPIAFVQLSGEAFEKRHLKLGIQDGGFVQVLEGLSEGDRVVTKEAFAIRLASVSSVIPAHGHAH